MRIAVPSMSPGGLESERSGHFGHCEMFTVVNIEDGTAREVGVIHNTPHMQGGCQVPVDLLHSHEINGLVVAGIGMRPLMGFRQVGIDVYFAPEGRTVEQVIELLLAGELSPITDKETCGGGGPHQHHLFGE